MKKNLSIICCIFSVFVLFIVASCGYGGSGSSGSAAVVNMAPLRWITPSGDFYIADSDNDTIRKVSNGTITLVGGTEGTSGSAGDNSSATSALFSFDTDVTLDSSGNLYVSDYDNNVVRKIDAQTGIVTLYAGTYSSGSSHDGESDAELHHPMNSVVDSEGNLFIADVTNAAVRKVNVNTGVVTTVAGILGSSGSSSDGTNLATHTEIGDYFSIALDKSDNIYISDYQEEVIRKVNAQTGIMTTIAGTIGQSGPSGDNGPATSALLDEPVGIAVDASGNIYFSDDDSYVRKIDASTGTITAFAGSAGNYTFGGDGGQATSAGLYYPSAIAFDAAGNVYIADTGNYVMRKIDIATGIITTVAGQGTSDGSTGDNGPATSALLDAPFSTSY